MARFVDDDLSGSEFREVVLSRSRFVGVVMQDVEIDGLVTNLVVNEVEVTGFVEAELDRRHPVRVLIRSTDPDDLRRAWSILQDEWRATTERLAGGPEVRAHASVDGEWSAVQTMRHLLFVHDSWFARAVLGRPGAFHPWGLASAFVPHQDVMGLDPEADPSLADVLGARRGRADDLTTYLAGLTTEELERATDPPHDRGWPPRPGTVAQCLRVLLDEEQAHHGFCVRDLDRLDAQDPRAAQDPGATQDPGISSSR